MSAPVEDPHPPEPVDRRRLLWGGGAAVVGAVVGLDAAPAEAASAASPWLLGGNSGVATDGSTFFGAKNTAPLVFKTTPSGATTPVERLRIVAGGRVGVGTTAPGARLDVLGPDPYVVRATSTASSGAVGVQGVSTNGRGVVGTSQNDTGVAGQGGYAGLIGRGGLYGLIASGDSGGGYGSGGDYGLIGTGVTGVYGSGTSTGVHGSSSDPNGDAVRGEGGQYGVHGISGRTAGVRGDSGYVGTWGQAPTFGLVGYGTATSGDCYGVYGEASHGYAVWAEGDAHVNGTLSKAAGSFRIDHPLDPEGSWLSHSFVESPDMMNVYNGTVVCGGDGRATVELPVWFEALNRDPRYQLTAVGRAAPDLHVSEELVGRAFGIAGGSPGLRVSWQVTGIRQDDYAREHPIVVEQRKPAATRGTRDFVPRGSSAHRHDRGPGLLPAPAPRPLPTPPR